VGAQGWGGGEIHNNRGTGASWTRGQGDEEG
jgi:hypothetical protein